jgi:hypothetical protein
MRVFYFVCIRLRNLFKKNTTNTIKNEKRIYLLKTVIFESELLFELRKLSI